MNSVTMEYRVKGYLYVGVCGNQLQRFFNICYFRGVDLLDLAFDEYTGTFVIKQEDKQVLSEIAKKYGIKITFEKSYGIPYYLKYYGSRLGFVVGAICCYTFLLFMSGGLWELEFNGNSYYTDSALVQYLEEQGIFYGTRMRQISNEDLELKLRQSFSDIAWCSVQKEGCKLTVTITESNLSSLERNQELQTDGNGVSIVADKDATIVSIVTQSGEPRVVAGQEVKKDDTLVQGYVTYKDDYDLITGYKPVLAQASIIARYTIGYKDSISLMKQDGESRLINYHDVGVINKLFPNLYYKKTTILPEDESSRLNPEEASVILENRLYEELKKMGRKWL